MPGSEKKEEDRKEQGQQCVQTVLRGAQFESHQMATKFNEGEFLRKERAGARRAGGGRGQARAQVRQERIQLVAACASAAELGHAHEGGVPQEGYLMRQLQSCCFRQHCCRWRGWRSRKGAGRRRKAGCGRTR